MLPQTRKKQLAKWALCSGAKESEDVCCEYFTLVLHCYTILILKTEWTTSKCNIHVCVYFNPHSDWCSHSITSCTKTKAMESRQNHFTIWILWPVPNKPQQWKCVVFLTPGYFCVSMVDHHHARSLFPQKQYPQHNILGKSVAIAKLFTFDMAMFSQVKHLQEG